MHMIIFNGQQKYQWKNKQKRNLAKAVTRLIKPEIDLSVDFNMTCIDTR